MDDWRSIVSQYGDMVHQTAYRILGDAEDAGDCVQETFLKAWNFSQSRKVRNWAGLLKVFATRTALDALRSRLRLRAHQEGSGPLETMAASQGRPDERAIAAELTDRLRDALGQLPAQQAEIFILRFLGEMSYRDIARQLGVKTSSVGVQLNRARNRLREILRRTGSAE